MEEKKARADAERKKSEQAARKRMQNSQTTRSAVFAAARAGHTEKVKKGIWEDSVDAAGGEVRDGCQEFVKSPPKDPKEALLHIVAKTGDLNLVEWLDSHSASSSSSSARGCLTFHRC